MAVPTSEQTIDQERWRKLEELFCLALELGPEDRWRFLAQACAGDDELRAEIEALLESHQQAGGFIQSPAVEDVLTLIADESTTALKNTRIGPYQIIKEISHGGMGAVYLASRADDQYKKEVAIKLVRQGFDSRFITGRFLAERQILANLDHPNIAKLLDGGTMSEGSPYLVMEYIEGSPIDEYCDSMKLSTAERLNLFRTVCSAVAYAHQNLVIHRDLKPSNILVNADGIPKLLDFGIAKILQADNDSHAQTATAARMMTPDYASPEQVRGEDITTAADIYSLGVLLYKLLTGRHPYRFKTPLPQEIQRVICESEPEKPSTAVGRIAEPIAPDGTAALAQTMAGSDKLRRALKGDLDNIVLMAMRKEPRRRYSSVEQFSADIARHLNGLPVIARKDTFSYRAAKFITRHKAAVAAGVFIVLMLVGAIIATASQALLARAQRDKARAEQAKSQRINGFLRSVLQYANPAWYSAGKGKGPNTTVLDALHDAAGRVDSEFADEPEVRADLHQTIGDTYRALGFLDEAERHFQSSLETRRELFGERSAEVAESTFDLGAVQNAKGNYPEAERLCREALAIERLNPGDDRLLPFIIQELTATLDFTGDATAAEPLDREALEISRRRFGDEDIRTAFAHISVARDYYSLGDLAKAEEHIDEGLRLIPDGSDDRIIPLIRRGQIQAPKGEYEQAIRVLRDVADTCLNYYHKTPAESNAQLVIASYSDLIRALCLKGDYAEAKPAAEYLAGFLQQAKCREGTVFQALEVMGLAFSKAGDCKRAQSYLQEALTRGSRFMVKDAWLLADARGALGECLIAQRRYAEAESLLIESYAANKATQVPGSFRVKESSNRLLNLYDRWGKLEQAAQYRAGN